MLLSGLSAARALGRLKASAPRAVNALQATMADRSAPEDLRCMAAWALGELRTDASVAALTDALRVGLNERLAAYVLEGLAKHTALLANDEATLLAVVENLVYFEGNRRGKLPASYSLLSAKTRTVGVNVQVLARTIKEARRRRSERQRAALYNAAFELLERLDSRRNEIAAGPSKWATKIDAAIDVAASAYEVDDLRTQILVLYFLGRMATAPEIADRASGAAERLDLGRTPTAGSRLLAVWALNRLQLSAAGPRRILVTDILTTIQHPEVLRLLGGLVSSRGAESMDAPQRWLELGTQP